MKGLFHDWQAKGITSVLHEKRGGFANNTASMYGLAKKAEDLGVRIVTGLKVTGFQTGHNSAAVTGVETERGVIGCDQVVVAVGPWASKVWDLLELPKTVDHQGRRRQAPREHPDLALLVPGGRHARRRSRTCRRPTTAACRR